MRLEVGTARAGVALKQGSEHSVSLDGYRELEYLVGGESVTWCAENDLISASMYHNIIILLGGCP